MFERKKENITAMTAIAIVALMLVFSTTIGPATMAQAVPEDQNGEALLQPFSTFTLTYGDEFFNPTENFIKDTNFADSALKHSMRLDFEGADAAIPSIMMVGHFKLSPGSCNPNIPELASEEVSPKMNGGPHHNDVNQDWADTMDLGLVNFMGDHSRFRQEDPHPEYYAPLISGSRNDQPTSTTLPLNSGRNLCTTATYFGVMAFKVNLDDNCDGTPDRVSIVGYADTQGLFGDGTPKNQWELTFKREYTPAQLDKLEGIFQSQVAQEGHPEDAQQTWRIDHQSYTDWTDATPNYKFVSLKEVTALKNGCTPPGIAAEEGASQAQSALTADNSTTAAPTSAEEDQAQDDDNNGNTNNANEEDQTGTTATDNNNNDGDNEEDNQDNNNNNNNNNVDSGEEEQQQESEGDNEEEQE